MDIRVFKRDGFGDVRVIIKDNEPHFVAKDVADILGYSETSVMLRRLDADEYLKIEPTFIAGANKMAREFTVINESGLYSAVLGSKKPQAKQFKKWVTSEVLPAIRKHGAYLTDEKINEILSDPDTIIRLATQLKQEREARQIAEQKVTILTHTNKLYTSTELAKELGFKSATQFNKQLEADGIQYKVNGTWVTTAKYSEMGLTSIKQIELDSGKIIYDRKWTGLGREFLIEKYNKRD